jgi:hypothetical protein
VAQVSFHRWRRSIARAIGALCCLAACASPPPEGRRFTVTELTGGYWAHISKDERYLLTVHESSGFTLGYSSNWNGRWTIEGRVEPTAGAVVLLHGAIGSGIDRNGAPFDMLQSRVHETVEFAVEYEGERPLALRCDEGRVFGMDLRETPLRFVRNQIRFEPSSP